MKIIKKIICKIFDHDFIDNAPDADNYCKVTKTCRRCGHTRDTWSRQHDFADSIPDADNHCKITQTCRRCDHTKKTGRRDHDFTPWEKIEGKCKETRTCQRCGDTEEQVKHNWDPEIETSPCHFRMECKDCPETKEYVSHRDTWDETRSKYHGSSLANVAYGDFNDCNATIEHLSTEVTVTHCRICGCEMR